MQNKLIPSVIIGALVGGAIAGGAITAFDKNTRHSLKASKNSNGPSKFSQITDDIMYWKDTFDEIRRNNPELERSLLNAKDTFMERKNNKKLGQ